MNQIQKLVQSIDRFQQRYRFTAFVYAVIKKYGEDQAGYQSALLTYYAFLSMFPLLLVLTTLTGFIAGSHPGLQHDIIDATNRYFPGFGKELTVSGIHKSGVALVVGTLFTFYGARGVADAFRSGVNHIWHIPVTKRDGFPKNILKSLTIIAGGGVGLILASICAGFAATAGHGLVFRILSLVINIAILFGLFSWLLNVSLPRHVSFKDVRAAGLTAAIGLVLLQSIGTLIIARELKSLSAVYSFFAVALGLLFWLYLQAQVMYYSVEIAVVHTLKLWPRSLTDENRTDADKRTYTSMARKEQLAPDEEIDTNFHP